MSQNYDPNQQPGGYPPQQPPPPGGYPPQPPQGGYPPQQPPQGGYPPQGGQPNYTAPDFNKMMSQGQADLAQLPAKWMKVLTSPTPQTFSSELPNANWVAIVTNVLVAAVGTGLVYFLLFLIFGVGFSFAFSEFFSGLWQIVVDFAIGTLLAFAFSTYVFGGKAASPQTAIMETAWSISLYGVPLLIIKAIVTAIAIRFLSITLIAIITLLFWVAVFYYLWMALQAVFKLSSQNAMFASLSTIALPLLGSLLLIFNVSFLPTFLYGYI